VDQTGYHRTISLFHAQEVLLAESTPIPRLFRSGVIVVDQGRCLACRECEVVCSLYHENECNPALSRIRVEFDDFTPGLPTVIVCKQCDWPACLYACAARWPEPAISVDPSTGARVIDPCKCKGCGDCLHACPLTPERTVIGSHKSGRRRVYFKCDLCSGRSEGPVCVQICPGGALCLVSAEERGK
jgi:carbon-monoxide dehydrogenase iron sulfur subunit